MAQYRGALPQVQDKLFLTDGGMETTLIFHEGLDLPHFAAFHLVQSPAGRIALHHYYRRYAEIARRFQTGLILESATWRANPDWGEKLGYSPRQLVDANRISIELLEPLRAEFTSASLPVVLSGCIGPRGDGYVPAQPMTETLAENYHRTQMEVFAHSPVDMVCAMTMNYVV